MKPVSFKGTKSYGMILFAQDREAGKGTVIEAEPSGRRLELEEYPLARLIPHAIQAGDCTKKAVETFFAHIAVESGHLVYNGMRCAVDGASVEVPGMGSGSVS